MGLPSLRRDWRNGETPTYLRGGNGGYDSIETRQASLWNTIWAEYLQALAQTTLNSKQKDIWFSEFRTDTRKF